jgi:ribose-phosphate pyrophosphokinase
MDLHAPQIPGFFNIPVDHLLGVPVLVPYFMKKFGADKTDLVVVSPDLGSVHPGEKLRKPLRRSSRHRG